MHRRSVLTLLGTSAADSAWPLAARAQQRAVARIGYLSSTSRATTALNPLRQALTEFGYIEGRNLEIEFSFADNQYDRLPALAADLVRHRVQVIIVNGVVTGVFAAKAATNTIPIVFSM